MNPYAPHSPNSPAGPPHQRDGSPDLARPRGGDGPVPHTPNRPFDGGPPPQRHPDAQTPSPRRDPDAQVPPRRDPDGIPDQRRDTDPWTQPHRDHDPHGDRPDSDRPDGDKPDSDKPDSDRPDSGTANTDRPDIDEAHARHGETTPAGISHHRGDPDMGDLPHRVPADPRYFTADVHVTPDGRARIGNHTYTPEQYGDLLRRNGWDGKTPIRLIGCDAGSNDFANRLSRHTGADVLAPTKPAWTDASGRVYTSDADIDANGNRQPRIPPNGEWETHRPDGTTTKASEDGFVPGTDDADKHDLDPTDARDRGRDDPDDPDPHDEGDPDGTTGTDGAEERYVPPTAVEPVAEPLDLSQVNTADPGVTPRANPDGPPPDPRRGAVLDVFPEGDPRVTKRTDGLIEEIDGVPVGEYVDNLARERVEQIAPHMHPRKDGPCSAVAIDLRTGMVTEGINGRSNQPLQVEELHPLLLDNYKNLADWRHGVQESDGVFVPNRFDNGNPAIFDGKAHTDIPLRHAEIKAANELLWARQRENPDVPLSPEVLDEMRVDPRWLKDGHGDTGGGMRKGEPAGCCANCDNVLRGVPSYTGRYSFHPDDYRYEKHSVTPR